MYPDIMSAREVRLSILPILIDFQAHRSFRVSDDEETNMILLRLLEYLGHPNPFVCAVAYNEVRGLNWASDYLINGTPCSPYSSLEFCWLTSSNSCLSLRSISH